MPRRRSQQTSLPFAADAPPPEPAPTVQGLPAVQPSPPPEPAPDPPVAPQRPPALDARALLANLNGPQREAAAHVQGPMIVFAGAGSGKTRVITHRIAHLLATGVASYRILAVTFTNKAAREMKERLMGLVGEARTRELWVGTFHAVCLRLLRRHHEAAGLGKNLLIYDDGDQRAVMQRVLRELSLDEKRYPPQQLLTLVHGHKQEGRGPDDVERSTYFDDVLIRCFSAYQERLVAANALDFEDLLLHVLRLLEREGSELGERLRRRFSHVLVDEFQDVNAVQYRLVRAFGSSGNICVVGDDDQSIYQWRGADVRNIRGFTRDFPGARLVKLEQNYRSTKNVVQSALGVIRVSKTRQPKELWTAKEEGEPVVVVHADNERDEATWIATRIRALAAEGVSPASMAIFYRVHAQSRVVEETLLRARLPYQVVAGHKFFDRAEIKDLLAYCRVAVNPVSDVDVERIINKPARGIGNKAVAALRSTAQSKGVSLLEAIEPLCNTGGVGAAGKRALQAFAAMMSDAVAMAGTAPPLELAQHLLDASGYADWLTGQETDDAETRLNNLKELLGSIHDYERERAEAGEPASMGDFLAQVALTSDVDGMEDAPRVSLMTVHAAKGLEFDVVFVPGMEEELFPLKPDGPRADERIDEERRLVYVAITRAREQLYLLHTRSRVLYGDVRYNAPSRFLRDIPPERTLLLRTEHLEHGLAASGQGAFTSRSWGGGGARSRGQTASAARPGERYVELDDADWGDLPDADLDDAVSVRVGARVRHQTFGVGKVKASSGGRDPVLTVEFEGATTRRIKASFLSPA